MVGSRTYYEEHWTAKVERCKSYWSNLYSFPELGYVQNMNRYKYYSVLYLTLLCSTAVYSACVWASARLELECYPNSWNVYSVDEHCLNQDNVWVQHLFKCDYNWDGAVRVSSGRVLIFFHHITSRNIQMQRELKQEDTKRAQMHMWRGSLLPLSLLLLLSSIIVITVISVNIRTICLFNTLQSPTENVKPILLVLHTVH